MRRMIVIALALLLIGNTELSARPQNWLSAFSAPPTEKVPDGIIVGGRTIRQFMRIDTNGQKLRLRLSNAENNMPLKIGAVSLGDKTVNFNGRASATIAPGSVLFSDPVSKAVKRGDRVEVRLFLPEVDARPTIHWYGLDTASISPLGNFVAGDSFPTDSTSTFRFIVSGVDIENTGRTGLIAAVGDSITDGYGATIDGDNRWPDLLARRLMKAGRNISVVNAGIGGNRLLRDGTFTGAGRALLARLNDDVLMLDGLTTVFVLIGINDIGWPGSHNRDGMLHAPLSEMPQAADIIDGYCQIATRARSRGLRVIGATILPFGEEQSSFYTPEKDIVRQAVNKQLREGACFDALVDFDLALRDPQNPSRLLPLYNSGDNIHPSLAGFEAMANAVDLAQI